MAHKRDAVYLLGPEKCKLKQSCYCLDPVWSPVTDSWGVVRQQEASSLAGGKVKWYDC